MSFFEELKHRNVFRAGIACSAAACVMIRALDLFLPVLEAPVRVLKVFSALIIVGYPVVLIFARVCELTRGAAVQPVTSHLSRVTVLTQGAAP